MRGFGPYAPLCDAPAAMAKFRILVGCDQCLAADLAADSLVPPASIADEQHTRFIDLYTDLVEDGLARGVVSIGAVRKAAEESGYAHRDIVSGAGHDAGYISRVAPTGMVFVPCADGISHNEVESALPEDLAAGCNVLLRAMLKHAA